MTGNMTIGGTDGVNWGGSDPSQTINGFQAGVNGTVDASGGTVYYLIHRMCRFTGPINGTGPGGAPQSCAFSVQAQTGSTQSTPDYSSYGLSTSLSPYYRITVRVNGAKNTVSYVQAIVLI